MSEADLRPAFEAQEELLADMPLPSDPKTFFLGGLFLLATLSTAYIARDIVLPLIFAIMLNLLLQPTLRALERLHVPKTLGAILIILLFFATIVGLGAAIGEPRQLEAVLLLPLHRVAERDLLAFELTLGGGDLPFRRLAIADRSLVGGDQIPNIVPALDEIVERGCRKQHV